MTWSESRLVVSDSFQSYGLLHGILQARVLVSHPEKILGKDSPKLTWQLNNAIRSSPGKYLTNILKDSIQFSHSFVSNSLRPHGLQHAWPLFITNSQSLLTLMSMEMVMPSNHFSAYSVFNMNSGSIPKFIWKRSCLFLFFSFQESHGGLLKCRYLGSTLRDFGSILWGETQSSVF